MDLKAKMKNQLFAIIFTFFVFGVQAQIKELTNGNVGIGTDTPNFKLHIKNPVGGAALGIERGNKLWRFDIQPTGDKFWLGNTDAPSLFEFSNTGAFVVTTRYSDLAKANVTVLGKKEDGSGLVSGSLISGNADNAKFDAFNVGIESWYGIGFKSSFNNKAGIIFNTRTASAFFNGNVGIGTDTPNLKLHIKNPIGGAALGIERGNKLWRFDIQPTGDKFWLGNTDAPSLFEFSNTGAFVVTTRYSDLAKANVTVLGKKEDGSGLVSGSLISGNADNAKFGAFNVGIESWYGIGFKSSFNNKAGIIFNTRTASAFFDGNVGIGTDDTKGWKFAVNGKIRAKEIKVEANWSDFVFLDNYKLPTLKEVENHIKEKGHLKDIPSAKEVEENGIFLGEIESKLLQKIEELTLYTIAQEKKINDLEQQKHKIEEQKEEIEKLKVLIGKLVKTNNN